MTYATGFLLGHHFTMGSRLSKDIYAFGLQLLYTKGIMTGASSVKLSTSTQTSLKKDLEIDNDVTPVLSQEHTVDQKGFTSNSKTVFAGFPGMSLCIGVRL